MTPTPDKTAVIIVAAGSGSRFGSELPKQFCPLDGVPVLVHAIRRFRSALPQARIIVVVAPDRKDFWTQMSHTENVPYTITALGGATRWESVRNALDLVARDTETILVHDGARPLVEAHVIFRLLDEIERGADGALPVMPMIDSLRMLSTDSGSTAVDRSRFRAVQTPQAFRAKHLRSAYRLPWSPLMTDDASVMENAGFKDITLVEGSEKTLKITRPVDIRIAALYLHEND